MAVFMREVKANAKTLLVWSVSVGGLVFLMMMLFPSMKDALSEAMQQGVYSSMPKTVMDSFGINLGISNLIGFYGVEAGFMLSLGGGLFGALLGAGMLSKEEANHSAEFLFTTPVGRFHALLEKLLAIFALVLAFDVICTVLALLSFVVIGEKMSGNAFWLYQLSQFIMHLEIACICFGISAFMKHSGLGLGLGVALLLYFLPFFSEVNDSTRFLNYISPFGYSSAGRVIGDSAINGGMLATGLAIGAAAIAIAFVKYMRKDLAS